MQAPQGEARKQISATPLSSLRGGAYRMPFAPRNPLEDDALVLFEVRGGKRDVEPKVGMSQHEPGRSRRRIRHRNELVVGVDRLRTDIPRASCSTDVDVGARSIPSISGSSRTDPNRNGGGNDPAASR